MVSMGVGFHTAARRKASLRSCEDCATSCLTPGGSEDVGGDEPRGFEAVGGVEGGGAEGKGRFDLFEGGHRGGGLEVLSGRGETRGWKVEVEGEK